jgi:hypothetical protein
VNTHSRLGTRNKNLHRAADGSLTLTASATPPADGSWIPPTVTRLG